MPVGSDTVLHSSNSEEAMTLRREQAQEVQYHCNLRLSYKRLCSYKINASIHVLSLTLLVEKLVLDVSTMIRREEGHLPAYHYTGLSALEMIALFFVVVFLFCFETPKGFTTTMANKVLRRQECRSPGPCGLSWHNLEHNGCQTKCEPN